MNLCPANRIDDWIPRVYKSSKNQSKENPLNIYKREFVCHCVGTSKQHKVDEDESQRKEKTFRCNCGTKVLVTRRTIGFEEKWVILVIVITMSY